MTALFSRILDMSLTGSIVIAAVLAARYFLRKSPKVLSYVLWAVVLFRLLCPVSLTAPVSVLEISQPKVTVITSGASSVSYLPERAEPVIASPEAELAVRPETGPAKNPEASYAVSAAQHSQERNPDVLTLAAWTWLAGVAIMLLSSLVSYFQIWRRLIGATPFRGKVYLADHIPTPFVLGILNPRIYIPSNIPSRERQYILAHEEYHIRRFDHIIKVLAYFALCLHWFNPLVWAAFFLAGKDMEMSCDEAVIRKLGPESRADYAQCLLRLATNRPIIAGTPLAFGEGDTKGRVKNLAKWRRPKTWVVLISAVLCALVLFLCAGNPGEKEEKVRRCGIEGFTVEIPWEYRLEFKYPWNYFMKGSKEAGGFRDHEVPEKLRGSALQDVEWLVSAANAEKVEKIQGTIHKDPVDGYLPLMMKYRDSDRVTYHHFYEHGDYVYELWFVDGVMPEKDQEKILDSIYYESHSGVDNMGLSLPADVVDVDYVSGEKRFFLTEPIPGQISSQVDTEELLGDIRTYDVPEKPLAVLGMKEWLTELGVPQIMSGEYDYMISGGGDDIFDLNVSFSDAGGRQTNHYYSIQREKVFELWLDTQKLDAMTRAAILQSVRFEPEATIDRSLPMLYPDAVVGDMIERAEKDEEETYLERCRSFLEELKACQDYVIQVDRTNYGGAVNDTSEETYAIRGEDWMRMIRIPMDGYLDGIPVWESIISEMYLDGQYYDNMENPSLTENREVHWGKTDTVYEKMLWFHRFDWDAQDVLYVSHTPAGHGMCITFQVMTPYYENNEACYNHYFVNFIFNNSLEFQRAEITAYFHDEEEGDTSIQEILRVTSREDGMAESILNYEYQRMLKE